MHTSSFCGDIDVTAMETNATRAAGAVVAGAIVTNVLLPFRRASTEDRKQMLQREDLSGLRALCNALRVKSGVSKAGKDALVDKVLATLAWDDAIYKPDSSAGKLATVLARMPDANAATDQVVRNFKLKDLKQFCKVLRLPLSGKKIDLAQCLVDEMRYTLDAISARQEEDVPPARAEDAAADGTVDAAAVGEVGAAAVGIAAAAVSAEAAAPEIAPAAASAPALASAAGLEEASMAAQGFSLQDMRDARREPRRSRSSDSGGDSLFAQPKPSEADHTSSALDGVKAEVREPSLMDVQVAPSKWSARDAIGNPGDPPTSMNSFGATDVAREPRSSVVQTQAIPDAEKRRRERRQRRRVRWEMQKMNYVAEELASAYGGNKENYMRDMRGILEHVPEETYAKNVDDLTDASNSQRNSEILLVDEKDKDMLDSMVMLGEIRRSRRAWCKWWDNTAGCGELLDLDDQLTVVVDSSDLQVAANVLPQLKYLVPSEIVEYRRVEGEDMATRAVLVRGMHGWPLRCEMDCQA